MSHGLYACNKSILNVIVLGQTKPPSFGVEEMSQRISIFLRMPNFVTKRNLVQGWNSPKGS